MPRFVVRVIVAMTVIASFVMSAAPAAARRTEPSPGTVVYTPPVDASVQDPFRPPPTPYGSGNRGIEYATAEGTVVAAAADGTVTFAGVVAGRRWVTIRHSDGVRTTYGPLLDIAVAAGDQVSRGDAIGSSAGALLFTARIGDAYIDPASLFGAGPPRVYLVPEPLDRPQAQAKHGWSVPGGDALLSALDWELRHLSSSPATIVALTPAPLLADSVQALLAWRQDQSRCTAASVPAPSPSGRRVAVLVGGLGSSGESAAVDDVDTAALGYQPADVMRFSYAGGRVPAEAAVAADMSAVAVTDYGERDTTGDIETSGHRLADVLVQIAESASPGLPVDVIAHSQGGLVVRVALADLAATHPEVFDHVNLVITLGSPHSGADLAEFARRADGNPIDPIGFHAAEVVAGLPISPEDEAVRQLAPGSDLVTKLENSPSPPEVHVVSIAARGDVVVPSGRSHLAGADNVIVPLEGPGAHTDLPGSAAALREMHLAIAGLASSCETAADAVLDAVGGDLIGNFEHALVVTQGG
jgi:hypothetical protein